MMLPGLDGLAIVRELSAAGSKTRVLILSAYVDSQAIYQALGYGASGYLEKGASLDEVTRAVRTVAEGGVVLAGTAGGALAQEIRNRNDERPLLTDREIDVLRLAADGLSAQQIARTLNISITTVRTHLQHVYGKLDVSDRAAAVAQAIRRGLLR
jgi:two-component system nitrate/nitrite response regulator NarL